LDAEARGDGVEARVLAALAALADQADHAPSEPARRQARDAAYARRCASAP
jgi:hypothetical protein